jgi:15-cis-phytoene desaturase
MKQQDAVVIGAGLAGLTCAWRLVERGYRVMVLEREPVVGGRTASWNDCGMGVESGFHRFIGYYKALPRLLHSVGVHLDDILDWEKEIDIIKDPRVTGTFGIAPVFAPLRLLRGIIGNNELVGFRDKASLLPFFIHGLYEYAKRHGVSDDAIRFLLKPLTTGIFFLPIERFSAYVFFGLLKPAIPRFYQMRIGAFKGGMTDVMIMPLVRAIERHGGIILTEMKADGLIIENGRVCGVTANGETIRAKETVMATPLGAAKQLLRPHFGEHPAFSAVFALPTMPAVTIQIETNQPSRSYDRTTFAPLTCLASFAEQSRTTFRHRPGRLSIILASPESFIGKSPEAIMDIVCHDAETIGIPLRAHATDYRVVSHPEDFHSLAPGYDHLRPSQQTSVPGLTLAGDYTRQPYFATMEGAVVSGEQAAAIVIQQLQTYR